MMPYGAEYNLIDFTIISFWILCMKFKCLYHCQGLDKVCPERMDDQQLLVVMTATIRHMPLVKQLRENTSVITNEIKHFRTVVQTCVEEIQSNVEAALEALLKGTRNVMEFEVSVMDDVKKPARRPGTAKTRISETLIEHKRVKDPFSGIEHEDNSRILESLFLESPVYSHTAVAPPYRMVRRVLKCTLTRSLTKALSDIAEGNWLNEPPMSNAGVLVDLKEFMRMFNNFGFSERVMKAKFKSLDVDGSGNLDRNEIKTMMDSFYDGQDQGHIVISPDGRSHAKNVLNDLQESEALNLDKQSNFMESKRGGRNDEIILKRNNQVHIR